MTDKEVMQQALDAFEAGTYVAENAAIKALQEALARPDQEPFGYFKAEPFGWTDCAETDAGAVALYERPSQ